MKVNKNLPNYLCITRIMLIPFVLLFLLDNPVVNGIPVYIRMLVSGAVFGIAMLTDMADGKIARKYNLVTNFGKIMDPLADKILVYSAFCLMVEDGIIPAWILIIILAREFAIAGMRTVAASEGIVIAAGMSGKIKTVLQMIAVPVLLLAVTLPEISIILTIGSIFLWASLVMTVYSGIEYIAKNKSVFSM